MASPTEPFTGLQISKTRKRGDTTSLLPNSYDPDTDDLPEMPVPEKAPPLYTTTRLQQSLVYAQRCLNHRNISPRSELFVSIYKADLKDALRAKTAEEREKHALMVMAYERMIGERRFLQPLKSADTAKLEDELLQLRELQYVNRYGDYMKIIPTRLRLRASQQKLENWEAISGGNYWSDIALTISAEAETRAEAVRKGLELSKVNSPTTGAVYAACTDLNMSKELALWSINEYGMRNKEVHRDLEELKREGNFPQLASILCADRNDLSSTFSSIKSETDIRFLREIIQTEIDDCFEDTSENPNLPTAWVPSPKLRQIHKDAAAKAKQPSKAEVKQQNIAKYQKMSAEKAARRKAASEGSSSSAAQKRLPSTPEPRGSEQERQERTIRQKRVNLISKRVGLEDDMRRINHELGLLEENDPSLYEQDAGDEVPDLI